MNTKSLDRNHAQQGKFVFECNYTVQVAAPRGTKLITVYNGEKSLLTRSWFVELESSSGKGT